MRLIDYVILGLVTSALYLAKDVEIGSGVMRVIKKRSKDHLLRSQADLQAILPPYTLQKDELSLIVLTIV